LLAVAEDLFPIHLLQELVVLAAAELELVEATPQLLALQIAVVAAVDLDAVMVDIAELVDQVLQSLDIQQMQVLHFQFLVPSFIARTQRFLRLQISMAKSLSMPTGK
jgi:hypothetical protein